jgi:hypothetical protein
MSRACSRFIVTVAIILVAVSSASAITRVAKSLGVLEFNGGYTIPTGSYDHIGNIDFNQELGLMSNVDGSKLYNSSYTLGLSYGVVRGGHWLASAGFQYSHIRVKDTIFAPDGNGYSLTPKPHFNQYDIRLNLNHLFSDLENSPWSPYVGATFVAGISSETLTGYPSENETNVALGVNFGAELKVWQDASKRNFVTLASANSWDFVGSGYRPRNLTIGLAVKAYMRP